MSGENLGTGNNSGSGTAGGPQAASAASQQSPEDGQNTDEKNVSSGDNPDFHAMVEKMVSEKLAPMKANVEKAYSERDALNAKLAKLQEEAKAAEIQRLTDEGKDGEVLKLKLSELQGKYEAMVEQNTKLSRDQLVVTSIEGLSFKNEHAKRMAMQEIINELVRDNDGQWRHKSGASVKEAIEVYSKDPDKSFLFTPKTSSGASTVQGGGVGSASIDQKAPFMTKPISQLTNDEMIQAQLAGRFGDLSKHGLFGNM